MVQRGKFVRHGLGDLLSGCDVPSVASTWPYNLGVVARRDKVKLRVGPDKPEARQARRRVLAGTIIDRLIDAAEAVVGPGRGIYLICGIGAKAQMPLPIRARYDEQGSSL